MKASTSKIIMKGVGATLAVCSALAMASSAKPASGTAKKAVRKTANKVAGMVDAISQFM
ncbi:MAG: hypothetical protein K6C14_03420 [Eubacterium sp.]|nr:hypothetical protein [Eubacterium sp.]